MQKRFIATLLITTLLLNGCASIIHNKPSWLSVETDPNNIEIKLYAINTGEVIKKTSPFRIELDKSSDYKLTVETPNYQSEEIILRRKITGWFWGNILIGWIVGFAIDAFTHNMWDHNQHLVKLDLKSLTSAPDTIKINIPISFILRNGNAQTKYLPMVLHKKKFCRIVS